MATTPTPPARSQVAGQILRHNSSRVLEGRDSIDFTLVSARPGRRGWIVDIDGQQAYLPALLKDPNPGTLTPGTRMRLTRRTATEWDAYTLPDPKDA